MKYIGLGLVLAFFGAGCSNSTTSSTANNALNGGEDWHEVLPSAGTLTLFISDTALPKPLPSKPLLFDSGTAILNGHTCTATRSYDGYYYNYEVIFDTQYRIAVFLQEDTTIPIGGGRDTTIRIRDSIQIDSVPYGMTDDFRLYLASPDTLKGTVYRDTTNGLATGSALFWK